MKPWLTAREGAAKSPSRAVLLSLIFGLFAALVLGQRALTHLTPTDEDHGINLARPDPHEVEEHRRALEADNRHNAYVSAQSFVRAELLAGAIAHFPDISQPGLEITQLQPHRFRVRSGVTWQDAQGRLQYRRFETDLQHGPADSHWRLVDTEFLDTPSTN